VQVAWMSHLLIFRAAKLQPPTDNHR